jgi:ATP-dependent exoDNAse (exonuclease V) alpha subunit
MRKGIDPAAVFDELHRRGQILIHASDVERTAALAEAGAAGDLVIADRREQVADLNAAIRVSRPSSPRSNRDRADVVTTANGEQLGLGDRVATRRNDPDLQVTNRQTWTICAVRDDGGLVLLGHGRERPVPAEYATRSVELAYATTVHGAQGDTVDRAHFAVGETTGAAAAYVAMTRGRDTNTAHLVAENLDDARRQWVEVFSRDRADLGPTHARRLAVDAIDRYGPTTPPRPAPSSPPASPPASSPVRSPARIEGPGM